MSLSGLGSSQGSLAVNLPGNTYYNPMFLCSGDKAVNRKMNDKVLTKVAVKESLPKHSFYVAEPEYDGLKDLNSNCCLSNMIFF